MSNLKHQIALGLRGSPTRFGVLSTEPLEQLLPHTPLAAHEILEI